MVLSNKAILPVLYELFPDSPYLLARRVRADRRDLRRQADLFARGLERRDRRGRRRSIAETGGDYAEGPHIYQEFRPLPSFDGRYPVVGSWIVNGYACGMGIREDDGLITRNTSRFVPHLFRKSACHQAAGHESEGTDGSRSDETRPSPACERSALGPLAGSLTACRDRIARIRCDRAPSASRHDPLARIARQALSLELDLRQNPADCEESAGRDPSRAVPSIQAAACNSAADGVPGIEEDSICGE